MFADSLFKMSFTKVINLHVCHIYIINGNTVIRSQIDQGLEALLSILWHESTELDITIYRECADTFTFIL